MNSEKTKTKKSEVLKPTKSKKIERWKTEEDVADESKVSSIKIVNTTASVSSSTNKLKKIDTNVSQKPPGKQFEKKPWNKTKKLDTNTPKSLSKGNLNTQSKSSATIQHLNKKQQPNWSQNTHQTTQIISIFLNKTQTLLNTNIKYSFNKILSLSSDLIFQKLLAIKKQTSELLELIKENTKENQSSNEIKEEYFDYNEIMIYFVEGWTKKIETNWGAFSDEDSTTNIINNETQIINTEPSRKNSLKSTRLDSNPLFEPNDQRSHIINYIYNKDNGVAFEIPILRKRALSTRIEQRLQRSRKSSEEIEKKMNEKLATAEKKKWNKHKINCENNNRINDKISEIKRKQKWEKREKITKIYQKLHKMNLQQQKIMQEKIQIVIDEQEKVAEINYLRRWEKENKDLSLLKKFDQTIERRNKYIQDRVSKTTRHSVVSSANSSIILNSSQFDQKNTSLGNCNTSKPPTKMKKIIPPFIHNTLDDTLISKIDKNIDKTASNALDVIERKKMIVNRFEFLKKIYNENFIWNLFEADYFDWDELYNLTSLTRFELMKSKLRKEKELLDKIYDNKNSTNTQSFHQMIMFSNKTSSLWNETNSIGDIGENEDDDVFANHNDDSSDADNQYDKDKHSKSFTFFNENDFLNVNYLFENKEISKKDNFSKKEEEKDKSKKKKKKKKKKIKNNNYNNKDSVNPANQNIKSNAKTENQDETKDMKEEVKDTVVNTVKTKEHDHWKNKEGLTNFKCRERSDSDNSMQQRGWLRTMNSWSQTDLKVNYGRSTNDKKMKRYLVKSKSNGKYIQSKWIITQEDISPNISPVNGSEWKTPQKELRSVNKLSLNSNKKELNSSFNHSTSNILNKSQSNNTNSSGSNNDQCTVAQSSNTNNNNISAKNQTVEQEKVFSNLILKSDLTNNTNSTWIVNSDSLINIWEKNQITVKWCKICNMILPNDQDSNIHIFKPEHQKIKKEYGLSIQEEANTIMIFQSFPGDINEDLKNERVNAIKLRVKKIKQRLVLKSVKHENWWSYKQDFPSINKQRIQKLSFEIEKHIFPNIKDYDNLEGLLKDLIKILDQKKQNDLHLLRQVKVIHCLVEVLKKPASCHKSEIKNLGKILELIIKILTFFSSTLENRNYMIITNRISVIADLLLWVLNKPSKSPLGISFLPDLISIINIHIKHRIPFEYWTMKDDMLEYLFLSNLVMKFKLKYVKLTGPIDLTSGFGSFTWFLLKSLAMFESLTMQVNINYLTKPVYIKQSKVSENILYMLEYSELIGIVHWLSVLLLSNGPIKQSQKIALQPQTVISASLFAIKILNNISRIDLNLVQSIINLPLNQDQIQHILIYIICYSLEYIDTSDDIKEMLHEVLLMISYLAWSNEKFQAIVNKGGTTIIQHICNWPFSYFSDKQWKDILFPTLINMTYNNERNTKILSGEINLELLVMYWKEKIQLEPILEEELDEVSSSNNNEGKSIIKINKEQFLSNTSEKTEIKSRESPSQLHLVLKAVMIW